MKIFNEKIKPNLGNIGNFAKLEAQDLVDCAHEVGQRITEVGLKNHQLRRFYNAVKQIERKTFGRKDNELPDEVLADLAFLRPHLANAERREEKEKEGIKQLREVLDACLASGTIKKPEDLTRFVKFFESIVAYAG